MADSARDVETDIIANDKTSKGINSAASRFDRLNRRIQDKANDWGKYGDSAGKQFAGKALAAASKAAEMAAKVGGKIMSGISGAIDAAGPVVKGALVAVLLAAAVAAAPVMGAAISAAVLLGLGGGVLAAGIALAASSPKVKTAAESLKNRFMDIDTGDLEANYAAAQERMTNATGKESKKRAAKDLAEAKSALDKANAYNKKNFSLKDAAQPFVEPLTRAMQTFQKAADQAVPKVAGLFKQMAPTIDKLAPALVKMAENALPGIATAIERSAPLWDKLAEVIPKIGTYVSMFFDKISANSPQSAQFISDMINLFGALLVTFGQAIAWLTKFYSWARTVWIAFGGFIKTAIGVALSALGMLVTGAAKALGWIPGLGPKLQTAAEEFNKFKNRVNKYLDGIQDESVTVSVAMRVTGNASSSAVAAALRKQGATAVFDRAASWAFAGGDGYRGRAGGPTPVSVANDVTVLLDGAPFYAMTASAVARSERRQAWRAKVGRR